MSSFPAVAARALLQSLLGEGQHVNHRAALEGLGWRLAGERPEGSPHSVFRILNHMIFWQDLYLERLDGLERPSPAHADAGWPGADRPAGVEEWEQAVAYFAHGLTRARALVREETLAEPLANWGGRSRYEALAGIATHNSYHIGQVVLVRRTLDAWPPPGGGDTW